jgi:hypothetical protein
MVSMRLGPQAGQFRYPHIYGQKHIFRPLFPQNVDSNDSWISCFNGLKIMTVKTKNRSFTNSLGTRFKIFLTASHRVSYWKCVWMRRETVFNRIWTRFTVKPRFNASILRFVFTWVWMTYDSNVYITFSHLSFKNMASYAITNGC